MVTLGAAVPILAASLVAATAAPQPADLSLGGSVINSRTGEPVNRALVEIVGYRTRVLDTPDEVPATPQAPPVSETFTDASGRFRFDSLAPGPYSISAQKPHFVAEDDVPQQVQLTASRADLMLKVTPLGVIAGKITNQDGEPVRGVNVLALSTQVTDGLRKTKTDRNVTTDDRGIYRMWNVSPAKYFIKAAGWSGGTILYAGDNQPQTFADETFTPVYFGGGKSLDSATAIPIDPGMEATADMSLKLETAYKIRGSLSNFTARRTVKFELLSGDEDVSAGRVSVNGDTGRFEIDYVASGSYIVRATQDKNSGDVPVTVSGADVSGVTLSLAGAVNVPGRITLTNQPPNDPQSDGRIPRFDRTPCAIALYPGGRSGQTYRSGKWQGEETAISGVMAGTYRVEATCFGAYVLSAHAGTQDLLADPHLNISPDTSPPTIEVIAKFGGGSVHGAVSCDAAVKAPEIQVLLVPQFAGSTGPVLAQTFDQGDGNGSNQFTIAGLAPGIYLAYAFLNREDIEYRNPQFVRSLNGGVTVQVDNGNDKEIRITDVIR